MYPEISKRDQNDAAEENILICSVQNFQKSTYIETRTISEGFGVAGDCTFVNGFEKKKRVAQFRKQFCTATKSCFI